MAIRPFALNYIRSMNTIDFDTIYETCEQMTSYEGQRAYDANGDSLYSSVHLTMQSLPMVYTFASQACDMIGRVLRHVIKDTKNWGNYATVEYVDDDSLIIRASAQKDMESFVSAYVMWQWLSLRLPERSEAWHAIYENALQSLPKIYYRLKPTLT